MWRNYAAVKRRDLELLLGRACLRGRSSATSARAREKRGSRRRPRSHASTASPVPGRACSRGSGRGRQAKRRTRSRPAPDSTGSRPQARRFDHPPSPGSRRSCAATVVWRPRCRPRDRRGAWIAAGRSYLVDLPTRGLRKASVRFPSRTPRSHRARLPWTAGSSRASRAAPRRIGERPRGSSTRRSWLTPPPARTPIDASTARVPAALLRACPCVPRTRRRCWRRSLGREAGTSNEAAAEAECRSTTCSTRSPSADGTTQSPTATSAPMLRIRNGSSVAAERRAVLQPRSSRDTRPGSPGEPIRCQAASSSGFQPSAGSGSTRRNVAL